MILLDEHSAVDAQTTTVLLDQLIRWHRDGRTMIVVLSDLTLVWVGFRPSAARQPQFRRRLPQHRLQCSTARRGWNIRLLRRFLARCLPA
jgi:hypothetical protein